MGGGSLESIELIEELIEWSIKDSVYWESEGQMVHYRLCGWEVGGSRLMD